MNNCLYTNNERLTDFSRPSFLVGRSRASASGQHNCLSVECVCLLKSGKVSAVAMAVMAVRCALCAVRCALCAVRCALCAVRCAAESAEAPGPGRRSDSLPLLLRPCFLLMQMVKSKPVQSRGNGVPKIRAVPVTPRPSKTAQVPNAPSRPPRPAQTVRPVKCEAHCNGKCGFDVNGLRLLSAQELDYKISNRNLDFLMRHGRMCERSALMQHAVCNDDFMNHRWLGLEGQMNEEEHCH